MHFLLAGETPAAPGGPMALLLTLLPWLLFIFLFYYLFVSSPMKKKQKEFQNLMSQLKAGDRVLTNSGLYGHIIEIQEKTIKIRIANNVAVLMDKSAIAGLAPEEAKEEKK